MWACSFLLDFPVVDYDPDPGEEMLVCKGSMADLRLSLATRLRTWMEEESSLCFDETVWMHASMRILHTMGAGGVRGGWGGEGQEVVVFMSSARE